jgi:carbon monoxide dehydrogenase subunit G
VIWRLAPVFVALLLAPALARAESVAKVQVVKQGDAYVVEATISAPVPLAEAWAVLTDFDQMARFIPNLTESDIRERQGNRIKVHQKGVARFGLFRFPFDSLREIDLTPNEMVRSRQISGATRSAQSQTIFTESGGVTRISYRAEIEPGFWLPAFISRPFIEHEVREQFEAIVGEMTRRHGLATGARSPASVP